jgi:nitrate/TMAO reductase-like tetraheme cytochrome c subunit
MSDEAVRRTTPTKAGRTPQARRRRLFLVWGSVGFVLLAALAASMVYTEQSSFCPTCHEMRPYYTAWQTGGHATKAQCVDCHIDAGVLAHMTHKPGELKELWDHFFVDNRFPNYDVEIPNSRCVACHKRVAAKSGSTFSHAQHANRAKCQECHATTAHIVTLAALQAEGVLKAAATTPPVPAGLKPTTAAGHKEVSCQQCHDQANMKCSVCHQAPHEPRGECSTCHVPGTDFKFDHGAKGTDCSQCHTAPANHFGVDCSACHSPGVPFKDTVFDHPRRVGEHDYRSFPCAKCHPGGYTTSSCTCHGGKAPTGD